MGHSYAVLRQEMTVLALLLYLYRRLSSDKGIIWFFVPLSEDNLYRKIIFNNTGYLILMLGAVGYSPVVSPHRIKQV